MNGRSDVGNDPLKGNCGYMKHSKGMEVKEGTGVNGDCSGAQSLNSVMLRQLHIDNCNFLILF